MASVVDIGLMTLKAAGKSFVNTVLYSCLCVILYPVFYVKKCHQYSDVDKIKFVPSVWSLLLVVFAALPWLVLVSLGLFWDMAASIKPVGVNACF